MVDLLVLGGGMAGCATALRAAQVGARVVLVEKAPTLGGSAAAAGFLWSAPSLDVMRRENPDGDPALTRRLVEDYDAAVDWVRSLGVDVGVPVKVIGFGRGRSIANAQLFAACERAPIELVLGAATERLVLEDGRVCGVQLRSGRRILARATVLATGGFGGDPELRARLIHPQARDLPLRANRYSTGDGMRLGRSVGAAVGEPGAGFYGHLIPAGIPYDDPAEFADLTFYHSEHGTLVNRAGRRFVDESRGDQISPMHLVRQPEARALLIYDQQARERWELQPYVEGIAPLDKFTLARERGARCAVVRHVNELARPATQWGYPGAETVAAVRGRRGEPPYYVIEVAPAITFSFTGLRIDPQARVLDERGAPIPCLLAAGADTGGVFVRAYAGGLANALIFGLQAAETALAA